MLHFLKIQEIFDLFVSFFTYVSVFFCSVRPTINKIKQLFGQNKCIILPEANNHQQMDKFISSGSLLKATIPNFNFTKFNKALTETFISEKIIIRDL